MRFHCFENIWLSQQRQKTARINLRLLLHISIEHGTNIVFVDECLLIDRQKYTFQRRLQRLASYTFIVNVAKIAHRTILEMKKKTKKLNINVLHTWNVQTHSDKHLLSQKGFYLVVQSTLILCVKFCPSHVVVLPSSSMAATVNVYNSVDACMPIAYRPSPSQYHWIYFGSMFRWFA